MGEWGRNIGNDRVFAREVESLENLAAGGGQHYEIYNAKPGTADGGWQTGIHWKSEPDQTWSLTAHLRMIYCGLFGMCFTALGIEFRRVLLPAGATSRFRNFITAR